MFLPSAFHYFLFPINTSISGVSKQRRVNGNESGASRHALAAISVVHLVAHTSCHHGQRGVVCGRRFAKAAGVRHLFGEITRRVISFRRFYSLFHAGWVGNVWREMKEEEQLRENKYGK